MFGDLEDALILEEEIVAKGGLMPFYDDSAEDDQLRLDLWPAEDPPTGEAQVIERLMRHFHLTAEEATEFYDTEIKPSLSGTSEKKGK